MLLKLGLASIQSLSKKLSIVLLYPTHFAFATNYAKKMSADCPFARNMRRFLAISRKILKGRRDFKPRRPLICLPQKSAADRLEFCLWRRGSPSAIRLPSCPLQSLQSCLRRHRASRMRLLGSRVSPMRIYFRRSTFSARRRTSRPPWRCAAFRT